MKKSTSILLAMGLLGLTATGLRAQVAINNSATNPNVSAILDLNTGNAGVNKGFLAPQVALTNVTIAAPVVTPATGLIVYSTSAPTGGNGTGYYYWNGTAWAGIGNSYITGSGIVNYVARWTPNGTTLGTGMIQDNGATVGINNAPVAGDMLYVNSTTGNAVYGYTTLGGGVIGYSTDGVFEGVYGEDDGVNGYGVWGLSTNSTGVGVGGGDTVAGGIGVYAYGDTAAVAYGTWNGLNAYAATDDGVYSIGAFGGVFGQGSSWGTYGLSDSGIGAIGISNMAALAGVYGQDSSGYGVYGYSETSYPGVYGENDNWIGVEGLTKYSGGAGVAGFDSTAGGIGTFGSAVSGIGVYGESDSDIPVFGYNGGLGTSSMDFEGYNVATGNYTAIDYYNGTEYKIIGAGTVSTTVKDTKGDRVVLHAPETPEVYFEDYGEGQLVNGKTHINLDATIAQNVTINEKHPLRVFIQLRGDCKGTYVTNESATGFDVIELNGGTSNAAFNWHIVCNRADEVMPSGKISHNADLRFEKDPLSKESAGFANHSLKLNAAGHAQHHPVSLSATNPAKDKTKRIARPMHKSPVLVQPQTNDKN